MKENVREQNRKSSSGRRIRRKKRRKWPVVVGILLVLIAAATVWMFGTGRIETASTIVHGEEGTRSVVVYFTRTGETKAGTDAVSAATPNTNSALAYVSDTEAAARMIAELTGADTVQLYTRRYYRDSYAGTAARAFVERYLGLRPAIGEMPDLSAYDTVFIGYPIWWFNAPMAVASFLESQDLNGKTVVPFCTSQDNDVDLSMKLIRDSAKGARVLEGLRFHETSRQEAAAWLTGQGIALSDQAQQTQEDSAKASGIIIYFDYSENINTDGLTADAVSSASIAEGPGIRERSNLLVMVDILKERTGYDVYSLQIEEKYAPMYMDMVSKAQEDKNEDRQFTFTEALPELSAYDTVFFGSPIWWYDMPQPVINFFERADLSGKNLFYFSINRGSGNSGIIYALNELQPNVNVVNQYTLNALSDNDSAKAEFESFLDTALNP